MKIGFIGQGYIGKNYADNFQSRGYKVVRYSLEEKYKQNKEEIETCDIVFIAVPTPTTLKGFDSSLIFEAIKLVGDSKIAVIKSIMIPGTTESLQKENPDIFVMHSPEFLREATARYDTDNPARNIIGIPNMSDEYLEKARQVMNILPKSNHEQIIQAKEAEMVKYVSNVFLTTKLVFFNTVYDLCVKSGIDYEKVKEGVILDSRIGESHTTIILGEKERGAGGNCFIKDLEAYLNYHKENLGEDRGYELLLSVRDKNVELLRGSGKDQDILEGVIGKIN